MLYEHLRRTRVIPVMREPTLDPLPDPHHRFDGPASFDALVAAIALATGADAVVVTRHAPACRDEAAIIAVAGEPLSSAMLQQILDSACTGAPKQACGLRHWHIQQLVVAARPGHDILTLTLLSHAEGDTVASGAPHLDLLRPLIDATFDAWQRMQSAQCGLQGFTCALDGVDLGIVLLDRSGAVSFANSAALEIIDEGGFLRWSGERISGVGMRDALALQVAIQHAIADNAAGGGSRHAPVLELRSADTGLRIIASIVPVVRRAAAADDIAAVVYLLDPAVNTTKQLQPVCQLYRLSAVEARLTCRLAAGDSLRDAAAAMRIKEQTARSYLKQVFLKTETNRQADLVRIMLTSVLRMQREIDPVFLNTPQMRGPSQRICA